MLSLSLPCRERDVTVNILHLQQFHISKLVNISIYFLCFLSTSAPLFMRSCSACLNPTPFITTSWGVWPLLFFSVRSAFAATIALHFVSVRAMHQFRSHSEVLEKRCPLQRLPVVKEANLERPIISLEYMTRVSLSDIRTCSAPRTTNYSRRRVRVYFLPENRIITITEYTCRGEKNQRIRYLFHLCQY